MKINTPTLADIRDVKVVDVGINKAVGDFNTPMIIFTIEYETVTSGNPNNHMPVDRIPNLGKHIHAIQWRETYGTVIGAKHGHYCVLAQVDQVLTQHHCLLLSRTRNYRDGRRCPETGCTNGLLSGFLGNTPTFAEIFEDGELGHNLTTQLVSAFGNDMSAGIRVLDSGLYQLTQVDFDPTVNLHNASINTRTVASFAQFGWALNFSLLADHDSYGLYVEHDDSTYYDINNKPVVPNFFSWL